MGSAPRAGACLLRTAMALQEQISTATRPLVFVVGAPRSGTTWLQRLLGAHPSVVTTQETDLISRYFGSWYDEWDRQLPTQAEHWQRQRHRGLPAVLTREEFDQITVATARRVYARVLALKPSASVVVDKNPDYSLHVGVLRRMFPDAPVIHIVRDGRDVAASMLAAGKGWGRDWAPRRVRTAAEVWRHHVEAAAGAEATGAYLRVRYEDLAADGGAVLMQCFTVAGISTTAAECEELLAASRLTEPADSLVWSGEVIRQLGQSPPEPSGFRGGGSGSRWPQWTQRERLAFDAVGGDLLRRLGYATSNDWLGATRTRRALARRANRFAATANGIGWRLHTALGRRGLYVHIARIDPYD